MVRSRTTVTGDAVAVHVRKLRAPLLRWYARHKRDLPWRRTRDPYAIWVSEVMLQQTQVATVLPYYRRFLDRFPDVASLAGATEEEVLGYWSGLGYYRRAHSLHAAAQQVMRHHGGVVPDDLAALRALPGVGRYTAGAIASIAFGRAEPVLDGNVRRVLARVLALDAAQGGIARETRLLWDAAAHLARGRRPGEVNQALMELGALVCTPAGPGCRRCPVRAVCRAGANGDPESYPMRPSRQKSLKARVAVAWVLRGERVLLERPDDGNPLRGTWDLPAVELATDADAGVALGVKLARHGLSVAVGEPIARLRHGIMNRRLTLDVFRCRVRRGRVAGREDLRWIGSDRIATQAVSGATRKVFVAAGSRAGDER
jgi:A/G-specific adenine glycosylase